MSSSQFYVQPPPDVIPQRGGLCLGAPHRILMSYAAPLIILSNCRNSVVSLTFCSLLRGIIRSHGKGVKLRQKPSNEVFPYLRGYKWSLFAILWRANAPRIMPDTCPSVDGASYWNMLTFWQLFTLCAA